MSLADADPDLEAHSVDLDLDLLRVPQRAPQDSSWLWEPLALAEALARIQLHDRPGLEDLLERVEDHV